MAKQDKPSPSSQIAQKIIGIQEAIKRSDADDIDYLKRHAAPEDLKALADKIQNWTPTK
jgi:hypothetical protein